MTGAEGTRPAGITVIGTERVVVSHSDLTTFPTEMRTVTVDCSSGREYTATWAGAPLIDLLELASPPGATTHVVVEAADGFRICVDVEAAIGGILAHTRDGRPIADTAPYSTRFVAPGVSGTRTAKDVATIETRSLDPGTDPETYETIGEMVSESNEESESETTRTG